LVDMLGSSCVEVLDSLIDPLEVGWIVEFYGGLDIIYMLAYRSIACLSRRRDVYVYINQFFGGLDPFLLSRFSKSLGGDLSRIYFSRGFRLEDFESFFRSSLIDSDLVIIDPYLHADPNIRGFEIYTKIASWIRRLSTNGNVFIFNRVSRYGGYKPEGGSFHHHSIHILLKIWKGIVGVLGVYCELVKHPAKPPIRVMISPKDLEGGGSRWVGQRRLLEWVLRVR